MQIDSRVNISISTDENYAPCFKSLGVHVVATPNSFKPLKAKYKARSLDWFARHMDLCETDWVLHLDEETVVDEHTIKACIDFAEEQDKYSIGQVCPTHMHNWTKLFKDTWLRLEIGHHFIQ
jgi:hypothetical protein